MDGVEDHIGFRGGEKWANEEGEHWVGEAGRDEEAGGCRRPLPLNTPLDFETLRR
jgi:hypothetical protein